ncbi:ATP-binding cassette long-chain fatty acid transporter pxa2 [Coemansia sp. RSA 486]|nr:ATP-binding cassette long-chain fatty acid transporter pxa2 [Coemansia sp. RSA 486]
MSDPGNGPSDGISPSTITSGDDVGFLGVKVLTSGSSADGQRGNEPGVWQESNSTVEFHQARVLHPSRRAAAFDCLSMRITQGHHSLVVGAGSDSHRQALLRVLQGDHVGRLLTHGILRSPRPHAQISHIGCRVYVKPGSSSLWDLLIFPHDKTQSIRRGVREPQLAAVLRFMDFEFLLQRASDDWGRVVDWTKCLGPGELYAVAVCRLLYHSPKFAIIDDTLDCLRADQVRQLFAAARMHHITMLVLADTDPFDQQVPANNSTAAYLACIGEFTRVLRLAKESWEFCEFGYAAQQPAFDSTEQISFIWEAPVVDEASREHQRRLSRRTSTLSQCSTTERRWLMNRESSAGSADTLASRRQSRVISPPLTARSSVSDFSNTVASENNRMLTIDSALAKYAAAAAAAATVTGSFGVDVASSPGPRTLKRRPLGGSRMFSAPAEHAEDAEQQAAKQLIKFPEPEPASNGPRISSVDSKDILLADHDEVLLASADTLTEKASKTAISTVAAIDVLIDCKNQEPLDEPVSTPVTNRPPGEFNPYSRAPRNYKRSSRSSISSGSQRTPPPSAAEVFVAPTVDHEDVVRRPFGRSPNLNAGMESPEPIIKRRQSRSYSRSSPAIPRQQLQRPGRSGGSRIPRPPTSSSVSTASSRSTAYSGSQSHAVVSVDELTLALDNL